MTPIPLGVLASARVAAAGGGGGAVTYIGSTVTTSTAQTHTHTGVAIGAASADRVLIIAAHTRVTVGITSLTVSGVAATLDVKDASADTGVARAHIYRIAVPSGTTADLVLTCGDATARGSRLSVWSVTGYSTVTPYATASKSGKQPYVVTLDCPAGGLLVAACGVHHLSQSSVSITTVSEDYDAYAFTTHDIGGMLYPTTASSQTVTVTSGGFFVPSLQAVSYSLA